MSEHDDKLSRTTTWIALAMVFTIPMYGFSLSDRFKPTPDSCEYIGLANSISSGQGYAFNGRQGSFYPPMIPIIAVAPIRIALLLHRPGFDIILLKLIQTFAAFGLACITWQLAKRYLTLTSAAWTGLAVLTSICVFQHCIYIVSDILFTCLTFAALLVLDDQRNWMRWLAGIILLALACLTRSVGLITIIAVLLALAFGKWTQLNRLDRLKRFILTALIAPAPYILWKLTLAITTDSYLSRWEKLTGKTGILAIIWERFVSQLSVVPLRSAQIVLNIEQITLPLYFTVIIFTLLLIGWTVRFFRHRALPEWFALCYIAVMFIWFDQGPRFFLPMLPLFIIYALTAFNWLNQQIEKSPARARIVRLLTAIAAAALAAPLFQYIASAHRTPAPMEFLRNGYLYCLAAVVLTFVIIASSFIASRKQQAAPVISYRIKHLILLLYISLGWLYIAGFAALEHRFIDSRPPMLAGYESYFEMGQWLNRQSDITEPVLCANASIVHLAGGIVTDEPAYRNLDEVHQKLEQGQYGDLLLLNTDSPAARDDQQNQLIKKLIESDPDQYKPIAASNKNNNQRYTLYQYQSEK